MTPRQQVINQHVNATTFLAIDNGYQITGVVTLDTAPTLVQSLPTTSGDLTIDLSDTGGSDSALLALLLAWVRQASKKNANLSCTNTPSEISSLIHLYGLESILSH